MTYQEPTIRYFPFLTTSEATFTISWT